jgi:hypothetical protein
MSVNVLSGDLGGEMLAAGGMVKSEHGKWSREEKSGGSLTICGDPRYVFAVFFW